MRTRTAKTLLLAATLLVPGCAMRSPAAPPRPARINHIVFFKLTDPAGRDELMDDCDDMARTIPGITSCYTGIHFEMGRANIDSDYDVGFYVGFDSEADYQAYVDHEAHVALVRKWLPKLEWLKVYDVGDDSP